ncbi:unnamed protein product [Rotaria sp. Silwood1]|nr:unnamed protein product [Rotaria sp. Silwood1]
MLYYQKHGFIMNKTQLEPNEVIVEIKGIGLNPVDIQLAKIPGADFSGRIYKIGDEVFGLNLSIAGGTASYLFTPAMILRSLKSIIGFGPRYYCINLSSKEENINQMFYMLNKGIIKPVIDSVFPCSNDVKQAYERLDTSRVKGKVVIDFDK